MRFWTFVFTGLSGSGKSTICEEMKKRYPQLVILDGDVLRAGISSDLGFSNEDREENIRRLIEICKLFNMNGKHVLTAFITPFEKVRRKAKKEIPNCKVVYIKCSLQECEKRDVKGLYKKARKGEIKEFTGITSPFEEPEKPDIILNTEEESSVGSINKFDSQIKIILSSDLLDDGRFLSQDKPIV
jgi:adenylylsulfate kinase